jgi:hypothetical protein
MRAATVRLLAIALLLVATSGFPQSVESLPGYFAIEGLGVFADGELEVDIDLRGPMAKIVAAATADEDPQFSAAMEKIERIRVQVGSIAGRAASDIRATIDGAGGAARGVGLVPMITVRDEEEAVYVRLERDGLCGSVRFVHDGEERSCSSTSPATWTPRPSARSSATSTSSAACGKPSPRE